VGCDGLPSTGPPPGPGEEPLRAPRAESEANAHEASGDASPSGLGECGDVAAGKPRPGPESLFATDHLEHDLGRRSVRGGAATLAGQVARLVLQLGSTAVLARLLVPEDFGLLAMVAVFTGLVPLFQDLGLSTATVQRARITHEQVSNLFWIQVGAGLVLAGITAALAPVVGAFYGEPRLVAITIAVGGTIAIGSLRAQHTALLRRQMRFATVASIDIASLAFGVLTAIVLAARGAGAWALVALAACQAAAAVVLTIAATGWWPGRPRRGVGTTEMVRFGGRVTAASLCNYTVRNADNLLVGRFVGAGALGVYSKAYSLLMLPLHQVAGPIGAVALPALSRLQNEPERFASYYLRAVHTIAYASMPLAVVLGVCAEDVVAVLLGPRWHEAAAVFRVFALFAWVQPLVSASGWVMLARDRADRMLRWSALQVVVLVTAYAIGLRGGAFGVAVASTVASLVMFVPTLAFAFHGSRVSLVSVFRAAGRPALVAAAVGVGVFVAREALLPSDAAVGLRVTVSMVAAAVTALALAALWPKFRLDLAALLSHARARAQPGPVGRA
jgi:O-antigen/teichoic acid export membrane protein